MPDLEHWFVGAIAWVVIRSFIKSAGSEGTLIGGRVAMAGQKGIELKPEDRPAVADDA